MTSFERLVISALVSDLGLLLPSTNRSLPSFLAQFSLPDEPALQAILAQTQAYTRPRDDCTQLITNQPLISIFSRINLHHDEEPAQWLTRMAALPAANADADKIQPLFPVQKADISGRDALLSELEEALSRLDGLAESLPFDVLFSHLLAILQTYTWCLPAYSSDVSFYDHARLTGAISACLYRYHEAKLSTNVLETSEAEQRFCLVVGDLSGIQDYIFDIADVTGVGGVARRLRARSFFISALSDVISHQVARRFQVPLGNILMSSGGKFYILIPNLAHVQTDIETLRQEIDDWFRENYNTELAVNLAFQPFSGEQFHASQLGKSGFGEVLRKLDRRLNRLKHLRASSILVKEGKWDEEKFVLSERNFEGAPVCRSCRKFRGDRPGDICLQCERDRNAGVMLPRTDYVAYYQGSRDGKVVFDMPLGCSVRPLAGTELDEAQGAYLVVRLNNPDLGKLSKFPASYRYLANYIPIMKGAVPKDFSEIAHAAQGRELLGYVKADVDYMGMVFALGLRRDQGGYDSAAHIAALSRQLDLFFSGWLQHLLKKNTAYQDFYTVFSGGDDLFLVGPWSQAASLAQELQRRFTFFCASNPELTLSAGLLYTKDSYPISRAARDVEVVLEHSKERMTPDRFGKLRKRDQITVMDDSFHWDLAPEIFAEIDKLNGFGKQLTSSLLHSLVKYGQMYRLWKSREDVIALRYKPLFAYNIARNLRKSQETQGLYQWADELLQSLHGKKSSLIMEHLALVATQVLFMRRERSNDEQKM